MTGKSVDLTVLGISRLDPIVVDFSDMDDQDFEGLGFWHGTEF